MSISKVENVQLRVEKAFASVAAGIIALMMVFTTVDVFMRYVFNRPLAFVFDLSEMLMVVIVYFVLAYVQQQNANIRVELFIDHVKENARNAIEMSISLVALAAFIIVAWKTGLYAWEAWVTGDHVMGLTEIPLAPAKIALTLGIVLLCLRFVTDIKNYFLQLKKIHHWFFVTVLAVLPLLIMILVAYYGYGHAKWSPINVGWVMLIVMVVTLVAGLPVSFALLILGIVGYWIVAGPVKTLAITGLIPYAKIADYTLSVVPLFILMGHFASQAGFARSLYSTAQKWIGHIPGSLAQATVLGGAVFAAACGSGLASCATLAKICIPAMREVGIDKKLAIGAVAGTATIAQMIPPSILMIVYAVITDQSVAKLLIAGVLPGILAAANYSIMIYIRCKLHPELAPKITANISWKERIVSLKHSWGIGFLIIIVMGGIYSGAITPTEAGALGASGALLLGFIARRMTWTGIKEGLLETAKTTGMIFLIIAASLLFGQFLAVSDIPTVVSNFLVGLQVPRMVILIGILVMYAVAGCFISMLAFAFLTLPIIFPAVVALGFDPIWFGVLTVHMFEIAAITPPFGMNLFIIKGLVPDSNIAEVIQGIIWFSIMDFITLACYVAFPEIATWLPSLMFK